MIDRLDTLLRDLLVRDVPALRPASTVPTTPDQVRFQPPDATWQTYLSNLTVAVPGATINVNALNVYLFDLRENRKLRSNELVESRDNGYVYKEPAPARIDCHYLVTAWSPGDDVTPAVEPTIDDHVLLYQAAAALMRAAPLNPTRLFPPAAASAYPPEMRTDLPTQVLPTEGFPKIGDFWQAMATNVTWKPGVYLIVTLPVVYSHEFSGRMVTTIRGEHRVGFETDGAETLVEIGGHVLGPAGAPVAAARVSLQTTAGAVLQQTESDADGRFTFLRLEPGAYRLYGGAAGVGDDDRAIDVPSPTGEYDLRLS